MRSTRVALLAFAVAFAAVPSVVRANDESIAKDWKDDINRKKGISFAKTRGEFWEAKGVTGKDLYWLGRIWEYSQEYDKANAAFEGFLKVEGIDDKLKQNATFVLLQIATKKHDWAKVVEAAEHFRKEYPGSKDVGDAWDQQGRAQRLLGERDKAVEAFKASAESKWSAGVVDLVDLYVVEGNLDEAKKVIATALEIEEIKKNRTVATLKEIVDAVGTAAPAIEKGCSIGITPAPTAWGEKAAVLYNWHISMDWIDDRLTRVRSLDQHFSEKANCFGISTYRKFNPNTKKVEEGMTEEAERDIQSQILKQMTGGGPSALLVPMDVFEGLKQRTEGQWTVIDAEGKIRYARVSDRDPYDWKCVELALKKVIGE